MQSSPTLHDMVFSYAGDPEAFARNPFRVLQIPSDARTREVQKRVRSMEGAIGVGLDPAPGPWPLLPLETATAEHIRAARDALASPMERIVHEFLWFWPLEAPGASDAACALLARGDIRGAEAIWRGEQAKGSPVRAAVALHNLAVLAHALALESVLSTLSAGATGWDYERDVNWAAITALWDEVFASDEAWGYVERRVSALADPAVTTEDVEALRQGALPTLVGISVGLALRSAARGLVDEALHHAQVGRDWAARLPRHQEAQPFDLATGPLRRSVEGRCSAAKQGGLADPAGAARRAHSLVEEVRLDLNTLDLVLGHHRALLDPCLDTFAGTILTLVGASTEATAGVGNALSLVTIAAWWAASPSVAQEAAEMRDYLASVGARPAGDRGSAGAEISAVISADMYTQNPFRMAALRVDCGATQIAERQEEVEAAARQVGKVAAGPWPWETMAGSGDPAAVAEALGTLSSPAERKVWEAFWFWPQHRDPSLWDAALARGQDSADDALDLWQRQTELFVDPCVPLHNIAVCLHLEALERERQGEQPERWTTVDGPTCEDAWLDAYTAWGDLLEDDSYHSWLALQWPEATTERVLASIRRGLLGINTSLAVSAALVGDRERVERHLRIVQASGLPAVDRHVAMEQGVRPLLAAVDDWAQWGERFTFETPRQGQDAAEHILLRSDAALHLLASLLAAGDQRIQAGYDQVAKSASACIMAYGSETHDWKGCVPVLERCLALARSEGTAATIREHLGYAARGGRPGKERPRARQPDATTAREPERQPRPPKAEPSSRDRQAKTRSNGGGAFAPIVALCIGILLICTTYELSRPIPTPTRAAPAAVLPAATPTRRATATRRPTATLPPTNCDIKFRFHPESVDVTIPDGTVLSPGQPFTKTWAITNGSTCAWEDIVLRFEEGEPMGAVEEVVVPRTEPDSLVEISVAMRAPDSPQDYTGYWRLHSPGGGLSSSGQLTVVIRVE